METQEDREAHKHHYNYNKISQCLASYLLVLLFNSFVNPEFRFLHQQSEIIEVIFDLFVTLDVAVRHEELDLTEGSENLLSLREVSEE